MLEPYFLILETWKVGRREEEAPLAVTFDVTDAEWLVDKLSQKTGRSFEFRVIPQVAATLSNLAVLAREYQDELV